MSENENNNADFDQAERDVHPRLAPAPNLTLQEFIDKAKNLLDAMPEIHDGLTGQDPDTPIGWTDWMDILTEDYLNS